MRTLLCMLTLASLAAGDASYRYPAKMGVVDLSQEPYRADPSGARDSTEAIQRALDDAKGQSLWLLWLPKGTYTVSRSLRWPGHPKMGPSLQGESREGTVIRLVDKAKDFADPRSPTGVLWTGTGSADNFCIDIRHLTVDTGKGNPGASGIQYMSNNQGAIHDVDIRSGDGQGVAGLDMAYTDMVGPCYISDVRVFGFDAGIRTGFQVNSMVLERIHLKGQREVGLRNAGQCVSVRRLVSENAVPAVINEGGSGFLALVDSVLTGSGAAKDRTAIVNRAFAFVRNVEVKGYAVSARDERSGREDREPVVAEFLSHPGVSLHPGLVRSLNLPVEDAPALPWGDPKDWANVADFGANPEDGNDDTEAIQKAIDSGAEVVYFPRVPDRKSFNIGGTIEVRGKVRRIIGLRGPWSMISYFGDQAQPVFRVGAEAQPTVGFTDLCAWDLHGAKRPFIGHEGPSTVVLRGINTLLRNGPLYQGAARAGRAFLEDVSCQYPGSERNPGGPNLVFGKGQRAFLRQFNPETLYNPKIVNDGADLWILGLKIERGSTLIDTSGRTEVLGGLCYTILDPGDRPMFRITGGSASFTIGEAGFHTRFAHLVEDIRDGQSKSLRRGEVPERCSGSALVLYASRPVQADAPEAKAPTEIRATAVSSRAIRVTWKAPADAGAVAEYAVYRGEEKVGTTTGTGFTDGGLKDGTKYAYSVAAVSRALAEARSPQASATTLPDREAPRLVGALSRKGPPRVLLTFSKDIDPASAHDAVVSFKPTLEVAKVRMVDERTLEALVEGVTAGTAYTVEVEGLTDRATTPNKVKKERVAVVTGKEPEEQLRLTWDDGSTGVQDNSAWKGGSTTAVNDGGALKITSTTFGQVVLAETRVAKDREYSVQARLSAEKECQVTIFLRQWDAPYATYGSATFEVGPKPTLRSFAFTGPAYDNHARVMLSVEGSHVVTIDDLTIGWFAE